MCTERGRSLLTAFLIASVRMYRGGSQFVNRISGSSRKSVQRGFVVCQSQLYGCTEGRRSLLIAFLIAPVRVYGGAPQFVNRVFFNVYGGGSQFVNRMSDSSRKSVRRGVAGG